MADTCPRCGATVESDRCSRCGVVIATPVGPLTSRRLSFHGSGGTLFGIQIVNLFLTVVTLGVYMFWGRVKVRRYLMGETDLDGDRFGYHGSGKELFVGALKAALIFGVPLIAIDVATRLAPPGVLRVAIGILRYGVFLGFGGLVIVGARRYRLSRTSWRGIRFSFRGNVREFVLFFIRGSLLSLVTLGLYTPVFLTRQYEYLTSHSYFGNRRFAFDGDRRALVWPFVKMVLLFLPTLGLSWFWYSAAQQRHFWNHTSFTTARFRSTVTGGGLARLTLGNILLVVVTLGLAWAWTVVRRVRYRLDHLSLEGPLALDDIVQEPQDASAMAEALSGFFDLDLG